MKLKTAIVSKTGGRKNNEDYCSYMESGGFACFVLSDGLGGHRGGAIASKVIVESIIESFNANPGFSAGLLKSYIEKARLAFLSTQEKDVSLVNMKATLVVLITDYYNIFWAHIGDSRLYLFRSNKLFLQTRDHSVPRHLVDSGEICEGQIRFHEDRNRLTRAFDGGDIARIEFANNALKLEVGDAILLSTDGFWEYVLETEMENGLALTSEPLKWLEFMETRLLAKAEGKYDNYSAIAIMNN